MEDSVESETWTIKRLLSWAADDFRKRELDSPRLEAEILLGAVLGVDRVRLILDANRPLSAEELSAYKRAITRRRSGEPSAYILGQREFFGRKFFVDQRVLIPRPDTEILVELLIKKTKHRDLSGRFLDLCTGSGCVAVSFALERPTWQVTGTDLANDALHVARKNAIALGAVWGVRFAVGDLFSAIGPREKFEVISANPPYIPNGEIPTLQSEVKDFEPQSALQGGSTGLDFYPRLARGSLEHLVPGGLLAVEVGAGQADDVQRIFADSGFTQAERHQDLAGHDRVVAAHAPTRR